MGKKEIYKQISVDELHSVEDNKKLLVDFLNETDYYLLVKRNALDFIDDATKNRCNNNDAFIHLNQYFSNFCNSFYIWKTFHNHCRWKKTFGPIKSYYQNNDLTYSMSDALRNYSTHKGFAITKITFDILNESTSYQIPPEKIIADEETKKYRLAYDYLSKINSDGGVLDALTFANDFETMFEGMQLKFWSSIIPQVKDAYNTLLSYVPSQEPECYNTYILSDTGDYYLHIGRTIELFRDRSNMIGSFFGEIIHGANTTTNFDSSDPTPDSMPSPM